MKLKNLFKPKIIKATKKRGRDLLEDKSQHLRVAAYARVSTDTEEQLHSYQSQIEKYERIIKEEHKGQWEFVKIYADEAKSGLIASKRPGYQEMLQDCRDGKIDLILCKQISRFGRNLIDVLSAVYELRDLGVEIYFELDNIFGSSSDTELVLSINSAMAQEESRLISRRVTSGKREDMKAGRWEPFFKKITGYAKDADKNVYVIAHEAIIVKMIFTLYLSGFATRSIAALFNLSNVRINGKEVDHNMIHRILRSEKYYGMVILQKTYTSSYLSKKVKLNKGELDQYVYTDTHPKVINPNVKELVERRNDELKGNYQPRRCFLYTLPVIYCAKCKERLSVDGLRKGRKTSSLPVSLTCIPKSKAHNETRCHQSSVNYGVISSVIAQFLRKHYSFNESSLERKARHLITIIKNAKPTRIKFEIKEADAKLRQAKIALQKTRSLATENPSIAKEPKYIENLEALKTNVNALSQTVKALKLEYSTFIRSKSDLTKIRKSLHVLFKTNKFMMDYLLAMGIGIIEIDASNYVFINYEKESEIVKTIDKIERIKNSSSYQIETYETTYPKRKINILYYWN